MLREKVMNKHFWTIDISKEEFLSCNSAKEVIELICKKDENDDFFIKNKDKIDYEIVINIKNSINRNDDKVLFDEEETERLATITNGLKELQIDVKLQSNLLSEGFSVEQALIASRKVNDWVNEIKNAKNKGKPLSPYEQYLYAYDIVTQFNYKEVENGENLAKSRDLISVLNGDRIVCYGYASLLCEICNRLGIACYSQAVNKNHQICFVKIDDERHNIHGIYASDPTNDSQNPTIDGSTFIRKQGFSSATIKLSDLKDKRNYTLTNICKSDTPEEIIKSILSWFDNKGLSNLDVVNDDIINQTRLKNVNLLNNPDEIYGITCGSALVAVSRSRGLDIEEYLTKDRENFYGTNGVFKPEGTKTFGD